MNYTDYNAKAWDAIAEGRTEDGRAQFTKIISHEDYLRAKEGILQVSLTSSKYVPESWFPPLKGKKTSWPCLRRRTAGSCFCGAWCYRHNHGSVFQTIGA